MHASGAYASHACRLAGARIRSKISELTDSLRSPPSAESIPASSSDAPFTPSGDGKDKPERQPGGIAPAFEWAQSPEAVFLNIKFAHKLDTPATLGCEAESVEFNPRSFLFRADCSENKKAFHLELSLLKDINVTESSWSMSSVGRAMVTLRKAENGTWTRLLASTKKPANMHVWWAMREKYEDENASFATKEKEKAAAAKAAAAAAAAAEATAKNETEVPAETVPPLSPEPEAPNKDAEATPPPDDSTFRFQEL